MKSIWKIAVKGILKRKTYTVAIFFLTIIASVSMVTALGTLFRTQEIYTFSYEKSGSPDSFYLYVDKAYKPAYADFFRNRKEVKRVDPLESLATSSNSASVNGHQLSNCVLEIYNPELYDFNLQTPKLDKMLLDTEVYAPYIYQSQFGAKIGDQFIVSTSQGNKKYKIAGFFEDPVYGCTFMGMKRLLFSENSYHNLEALTLNKTTTHVIMLNVYFKDAYRGDALGKTSDALNSDFGHDTTAQFNSNMNFYVSAVLIVPKIISVVLLCFSVLLILIVIIVIRHAILSSIEADYVSLGVLKAIGFTGKNLVASILLQYLLISGAGILVGILAGVFTVPYIGSILVNSTGIFWSGYLTVQTVLVTAISILGAIGLLSYSTARKAAKISPVMAISFGKSSVHFSSRLNVPLERLDFLPISIKMSLKQMMTKLKQYSSLIVITSIFTFMIIMDITLTSNFNTMDKMYQLFGFAKYDLVVSSVNPNVCPPEKLDRIIKDIDQTYGIDHKNIDNYVNIKIDKMSVEGMINSNFSVIKDSLLSGKLPQYKNEIALTPVISKSLGKGVGETVEISSHDSPRKTYVITGIMQSMEEMGQTVFIPECAYKEVVPDYQNLSWSITLKNSNNFNTIVSQLKKKYQSPDSAVTIVNEQDHFSDMFKTVQSAIGLASTIIFSLTFILISCITILLCTITIYREITDTGIFKAVGFKTGELRRQFAFRFMLISILGGIIGAVFSLLFDEKLAQIMLSSIGIANLKPVWDFSSIGIPILFVVCVTGITAYLCSAKIKKISPSSLISE